VKIIREKYMVSYFVSSRMFLEGKIGHLPLLHLLYRRYPYVRYNASINHETITLGIKYICLR